MQVKKDNINKNDMSQKYLDAYSMIINNPNYSDEQKKLLTRKLVNSLERASKHAGGKLLFYKLLQKIDLDKVATFEMLLAMMFPMMGAGLITWGLGSDVDMDLYNKMINILMNPVLKTSAVAAIAGLGTTVFENQIANKVATNIQKCEEKKEALEESRKEMENYINDNENSI